MQAAEQNKILNAPLLFVEPTNVCNLKCAMCPCNREMVRTRGEMSMSSFKGLVDTLSREIASRQPFLNLWGWGEPLLHEQIFDMVRYASTLGAKVRLASNLERLKVSQVEELVGSGLFMLLVALDGMSQSVHGSYRVNGNVQVVKKVLSQVVASKRRLERITPFIVVTTIATRHSIQEIPAVVSYCRETGVDGVFIKLANLWRGNKNKQDILRLCDEFIPLGSSFSRYHVGEVCTELSSEEGRCPFLDKNGVVLWNGSVVPCCFDHDGRYALGNVNNSGGYSDVLRSSRHAEIWQRMREKKLSLCKRCDSCGPRGQIVLFSRELKPSDVT